MNTDHTESVPDGWAGGRRTASRARVPGLWRQFATLAAALLSIGAVLLSNRWLGVAAVGLAGMLLASTLWAMARERLGPLTRLVAPVQRQFSSVATVVAGLARRLWAQVVRVGRRAVAVVKAIDTRLGRPVGSTWNRLPTRIRGALAFVGRVVAWLLAVAATALVLAGVVVVASGLLGSALTPRTTPIAVEWLYVGAVVSTTIAVLVLSLWFWQFGRIVWRRAWRWRACATVALCVVAAGIGYLSTPAVPGELELGAEAANREGVRGTDVLVAVDPADPAGRELAAYFRSGAAWKPQPDAPAVGFGLVVPVDPALPARSGPWTIVEPPTLNRPHFRDSIASVAPREGGRATGDYAALLDGLLDSDFLQWHPDARRTVVLVLSELPLQGELDRSGDGVPRWSDVVARYSDERARSSRVRPVVFTQDQRLDRISRWRAWTAMMGGRLVTYRSVGPTLVADLENAATGAPLSSILDLAKRFSPYLRFDVGETFIPVNVDELLAEAGDQGGHSVCDHVRLFDDCRPLDHYTDLLRDLQEYIDFEGGARLGSDLVDREVDLDLRPAIYVDAIEDGPLLHLAYWWFLRYNVSPWETERNCLPGLTFADATCFDHEGDWEGVTVTLRRKGRFAAPEPFAPERWRLASVSFASHKYVTRWHWTRLELVDEMHPVVYVAKGSHAAYPTRCTSSCTQKLAGSGLPEGEFGGQVEWEHDGSACCLPLPVSADRIGTRWNAFPGRWGKAVCTAFVKFCSQSDGPLSPSRQPRFRTPSGTTFEAQDDVLARHKARYGEP